MKRLLAKISLLLIGLAPSLAFAATTNIDKIGEGLGIVSFTPALSDKSVGYLGELFGTVGGVLHGTSGQIMSRLFEAFNYGILVVAGFFLIYTIITTIINTAQDGQFMGQKFNSAWVVIRTVTGLSLLVPKFSGYSMIQVIVMWVVVQGVGLANIAWDKALTYLEEGNAVHTKPVPVPPQLVGIMGKIMVAQVCSYKSGFDRNSTSKPKITYNANARLITFPNGCGTITYGKDAKDTFKTPGAPAPKIPTIGAPKVDQSQMSVNSHTENAIQQVLSTLNSPAKQVARAMKDNVNLSKSLESKVVSSLVGASADYLNLIQPARAVVAKRQAMMTDGYFAQARKDGWIMAGRYYFAMSSIQSASRGSINNYLPKVSLPTGTDSVLADSDAELYKYVLRAQKSVADAMGMRSPGSQGSLSEGSTASGSVKNMLNTIDGEMDSALNPEGTDSTDPIISLQNKGSGLIGGAMAIWIVGAVASVAAGAAGTFGAFNPGGYMAMNAVTWMIPYAFAISTVLFTTGIMLAVYLPLIPFIIFSFAALGWFIAVLEAVVAGPLVALGVTHPEGHDWLGKGEQAIMLLLSIFIRPVLMIIGLLAAMVLSRIFIDFLSTGFYGVLGDIGSRNGLVGLAQMAAFFIFASLSVTVVNVVYTGCIVDLTRKVMIWIGLHDQADSAVDKALASGKEGAGQFGSMAAAGGSSMEKNQEIRNQKKKAGDVND